MQIFRLDIAFLLDETGPWCMVVAPKGRHTGGDRGDGGEEVALSSERHARRGDYAKRVMSGQRDSKSLISHHARRQRDELE